jgi:hypothetical protein
MEHGKYDDLVGRRTEVDCVREASYKRAAYLPLDTGLRQRLFDGAAKRSVDLRGKRAAKPRALVLVPVTGVE